MTVPLEQSVAGSLSSLTCGGCGYVAPESETRPFRCPNAGSDDVDHVLRRTLDLSRGATKLRRAFFGAEPDPFIRYRQLTHSWRRAMAIGMTDADYTALVGGLERRIAEIDGRGFSITPFERQPGLAAALGIDGPLWVKDETSNVSGSHKGRHLMGLMIWLSIAARSDPALAAAPLAIASCGNAALAAAVVARAAGRTLEVFIPVDASEWIVRRLESLGARLTRCPRQPGVAGDPCYHAFRQAVAEGALPFTCQGNENGLVVEGGQTLGWEIASQLLAGGSRLDRLFIQVGGGALASACIAALEEARELGLISRLPRIHAVQTAAAYPLRRAYDRMIAHVIGVASGDGDASQLRFDYERMAGLAEQISEREVDEAMRYAVGHRSEFMWPWETAPRSVAGGILDDETYDWAAVVRGMLASGGFPVVVSEEELVEANRLASVSTGIPVDATGSSGLAGLLELKRHGALAAGESTAVLFTGRRR